MYWIGLRVTSQARMKAFLELSWYLPVAAGVVPFFIPVPASPAKKEKSRRLGNNRVPEALEAFSQET